MTPARAVRRDVAAGGGGTRLIRIATALLLVVLAGQFALLAPQYRHALRDFGTDRPLLGGSDFPAFYMGARLMLSSDRSHSYDEETQARAIVRIKGYGDDLTHDSGWFRYYNPPVYSLLLAPLGLLPVRAAYLAAAVLNLLALAGLVWLLGSILRWRQPLTNLVLLALVGSLPVLYAFWHAQPDILLCLILGGAFLLAERPKAPSAAGALLALAGIKPQWLLLPGAALFRLRPRAVRALLLVSAAMVLPFLVLGIGGTLDFIALARGRGYADVHDDGFAEALLSWSGFFRVYFGHVQPGAWLAFSFLTLLAFVPVWVSRNRDLLPLAAVLTTLLIGPHSHPQDWLLIFPAAGFMLRNQAGARLYVSAALLLLLDFSVNAWDGLAGSDRAVYWPTLAAFATLLWLDGLALGAGVAIRRALMRVATSCAVRPVDLAAQSRRHAAPGTVRDRLY